MPLDSTGYLSPTPYGERDILFHRPTHTEQEQANSSQSVRARRAVDEDGEVLRKILLRGAELIERDGWVKFTTRGPAGERCTALAALDACIELRHVRLYEKCLEKMGLTTETVCAWNNKMWRTARSVAAKFRSAAEQRA